MSRAPVLAVLQAHDRNGALVARAEVTQWPATVGRSLESTLVLDDLHVAPDHLRIDCGAGVNASANGSADGSADSGVRVRVMDTSNGVMQRLRLWRRGEEFSWRRGEELAIGRLKFSLRLADEPLPPEQPLPHFPWRTTGWTLLLATAVLALMGGMTWLVTPESNSLGQRLPTLLAGTAGSLAVWAGLWALVTRLFTGRLWFWRHVRIACATLLGAQALETVAHLLAFMFSWESLARFDLLINVLAAAAGVFLHLRVIAPQHRRGLAGIVAGVVLLGVAVLLSTSWLQTRRLSSQLYMATLFPPSWRIAPAVTVEQFLDEAQSIRNRLEKRLQDKRDEDGAAADEDADAE